MLWWTTIMFDIYNVVSVPVDGKYNLTKPYLPSLPHKEGYSLFFMQFRREKCISHPWKIQIYLYILNKIKSLPHVIEKSPPWKLFNVAKSAKHCCVFKTEVTNDLTQCSIFIKELILQFLFTRLQYKWVRPCISSNIII